MVTPLAFGAFGGVDAATRAALAAMQGVLSDGGAPLRPGHLLGRAQIAIWRPLALAICRRRRACEPHTPAELSHLVRGMGARKRGRSQHLPLQVSSSSERSVSPAPRAPVRSRTADPPRASGRKQPAEAESFATEVCQTAALWEALWARLPRAAAEEPPEQVSALSRLAAASCSASQTSWGEIVGEVRRRLQTTIPDLVPQTLPSAGGGLGRTRPALLGLSRSDSRKSLVRLHAWIAHVAATELIPENRRLIRDGSKLLASIDDRTDSPLANHTTLPETRNAGFPLGDSPEAFPCSQSHRDNEAG